MNNMSKTEEDRLIAQATAILYHHYEGLLIKESRERYLSRTTHPDQTATEEQTFWDVYADTSRSQNHEEKICHRELLRQAIHQLTPAEKRLLTLIYLYEIPQKQIASLLHITHQSITKAKKRLLTHLRQTISQPTPCLTCVYIL